MKCIIIHQLYMCTKLSVWRPKYSTKHTDTHEPVALLHRRKVDFGSPVILVEFPKAPSLHGQRFCIKKQDAQRHPVVSNGSADMYEIPMSHFDTWQTAQEVKDLAFEYFGD